MTIPCSVYNIYQVLPSQWVSTCTRIKTCSTIHCNSIWENAQTIVLSAYQRFLVANSPKPTTWLDRELFMNFPIWLAIAYHKQCHFKFWNWRSDARSFKMLTMNTPFFFQLSHKLDILWCIEIHCQLLLRII